MKIEPVYLGDGVYASFDDGYPAIVLTTGSHIRDEATNVIVMENDVVIALKNYIKKVENAPR